MRVLHTASHEKGQIYMPMVNWLLAAGTLGAVVTFGSSDALGGVSMPERKCISGPE
jgi:KUP system potassium uptake protein